MKKITSLIILVILLLIIFIPGMFIKVKVVCVDQDTRCNPEIEKSLSSLNNKSFFNAKKQIKKILNNNFMILEYSVQFKLPNILQVNILTKKPSFGINNGIDDYYLVDSAGHILAKTNQTVLPYIVLDGQTYQTGDKVDDKVLNALKLIDGVYKMYQTKSGTLEKDTLFVNLPGQVSVIFPVTDFDRDLLLGSLRLIYSNIRNGEGQTYSQIDMRYRNPVLR